MLTTTLKNKFNSWLSRYYPLDEMYNQVNIYIYILFDHINISKKSNIQTKGHCYLTNHIYIYCSVSIRFILIIINSIIVRTITLLFTSESLYPSVNNIIFYIFTDLYIHLLMLLKNK